MPNINDIVQIAEALEKSPVHVIQDRCAAVRNRNATCRRCIDVCPNDAIKIELNQLTLSASQCVDCGLCTAVCPTEALESKPSDYELASALGKSTVAADGAAIIACARISSKHKADPSMYAEVPCLGHVYTAILVGLASHGAASIQLVDGNCRTCKYRAIESVLDGVVSDANALIASCGGTVRVERRTGFPEGLKPEDARGLYGSTRRGFFSSAKDAAKDAAMAAAQVTIEQELGVQMEQKKQIGSRLRVDKAGALPKIATVRHDAVINAMDAIGAPAVEAVDTQQFATVDIDLGRCNACGMCAVFCPTGALKRDASKKLGDPVKYLEFSASDCINCDMCVDVCWRKCLSVSTKVSMDELFDFEPRVFDMKDVKRQAKTWLGGA